MAALLFLAPGFEANGQELSGDTTVYWRLGKTRCHVEGCKRLPKDPTELAEMTKTTWAEAKALGLQLCSKCPGSTTEGRKTEDKKDTSSVSDEVAQAEGPLVYWAPGKKKCHVEGCKRIEADMITIPLTEAKEKGLSFCSKCPAITTPSETEDE